MSTPEDVAALRQEATLVADGLRTLMWSYHYKGEERTYSGLIDRQRATIERLERALKRIKNMNTDTFEAMGPLMSCVEIARAALSPASAKTAEDR